MKNGASQKISRLKEHNMNLFNKLFAQQPKQPEYKWESWEVKAARYDVMNNQKMADLASQGIKKRDLYGWS